MVLKLSLFDIGNLPLMTVDLMNFTEKDFIDGVIIQTAEDFLRHAKDCKILLYT